MFGDKFPDQPPALPHLDSEPAPVAHHHQDPPENAASDDEEEDVGGETITLTAEEVDRIRQEREEAGGSASTGDRIKLMRQEMRKLREYREMRAQLVREIAVGYNPDTDTDRRKSEALRKRTAKDIASHAVVIPEDEL